MSVPKHWLLVGWYPCGLIVNQQRKHWLLVDDTLVD